MATVMETKVNPDPYAGGLVAIDAGRRFIKIAAPGWVHMFDACMGEARELHLDRKTGNDYRFEIEGQQYFVGDLGHESRSARYPAEKISEDTRIRIYAALAMLRPRRPLRVVTGVPVEEHKPDIKQRFEQLLVNGPIKTKLNGEPRIIDITAVDVLPEGAAGLWSMAVNVQGQQTWDLEKEPLVRYFDLGSMTCNCTTMVNGVWRDVESFTLPYGGFELEENEVPPAEFAAKVAADARLRIPHLAKKPGRIIIGGGVAARYGEYFKEHFPNAQVHPNPIMANALGYLGLGVLEYGNAEGHR